MKCFKNFCIFCLALFCFSLYADNLTPPLRPENIKILLKKDVSEVLLEVRGPYQVVDSIDFRRLSSGMYGKRFVLHTTESGIMWGDEFQSRREISIISKSADTKFLIDGIQYEGFLHIIKKDKLLTLVNEIDVESYLKNVLSQEFTYSSENEAFAAIAIAARTNAYAHICKDSNKPWHITADEVNYHGYALMSKTAPIIEAIKATRHLIIAHSFNGINVPFEAVWTEHSAGKTAPFHYIFRKEGFAPKSGVVAHLAALDRNDSKWTTSISKQDVERILNLSNIKSIESFIEPFSEKTYAIRVKTDNEVKDIDFLTFQKLIGIDVVKSNDLKISLQNDKIIFSGFGKGHGVGLCLYTSTLMAQRGDTAIKILSTFFPNTFLVNLAEVRRETSSIMK